MGVEMFFKQSPMVMKTSRKSGFTRGELLAILVVLAILGAIAIPKLIQARAVKQRVEQRNTCIAELRVVWGAKRSWGIEAKQAPTAIPTDSDIFGLSLYRRYTPHCPLGGTYSLNALSVNPTCSKSGAPDFHTL